MKANIHLDAGAFNALVTLYVENSSSDGCGGFVKLWQSSGQAWARILPEKVSSKIIGERQVQSKLYLIDVRQPLAVKAGAQLRADEGSRIFEVLTVLDPDETGRYWRCECKELET